MSAQNETVTYALRSGFKCLLGIVPVVALVYFAVNSQEFRSVIYSAADASFAGIESFFRAAFVLSIRLPAIVFYIVIGSFYWAQCLSYKLRQVEAPWKYLSWLFNFQLGVFLLALVLTPGALISTEGNSGVLFVIIAHSLLSWGFMAVNNEKLRGVA